MHLIVYVVDASRVARFYSAVLGLEVADQQDEYVVLAGARDEVTLVTIPAAVAGSIVVARPPEVREEAATKPSFEVDSLADAAVAARTSGGGVKPLREAWEFRGWRHLDGHDPEGNVIQLRERADG